jgi:hypothetical protein
VAAVNTPLDSALKAQLDDLSHEFRFGDSLR